MYYDNIASVVKDEISNKTDQLAFMLRLIMMENNIRKNQYMIIASYCLKKYREIGDLDVIVTENAYAKLKENSNITVSTAKISGDERIIVELPSIGKDVEIEFFPKANGIGFPSNYFSLANLKKTRNLISDKFGNLYYNIKTCIKQYSCVELRNGEYYLGDFRVNKKRVSKNLNHLLKIKETMHSNRYLDQSIEKLEDLLF